MLLDKNKSIWVRTGSSVPDFVNWPTTWGKTNASNATITNIEPIIPTLI